MAKNVKFGPDISCRKTGFKTERIKGTARKYCKHLKGRSHKIISNKN